MEQVRKSNLPEDQLVEKVIQIDRINKVVSGGKRMSFRASLMWMLSSLATVLPRLPLLS